MSQAVLDAMLNGVLEYNDGDDMAVWAAAFRRQAVWAACREDLTTDDEAERPITNRVVEKKCANSLTLVSVLHEHASRPDDKVCLFIKVVAAATNIHSKVNAAASFLNLIPQWACHYLYGR